KFMVLSYTSEVNRDFKKRMVWWYAKLNNVRLKIWQDPWLDFMLCWMIFDAYLTEIFQFGSDRDKLNYFYNNKSDFKNYIITNRNSLLGHVTELKKLSPIQDMRPNSNKMVCLKDEKNFEQIFNFVYQIRCNLFHGAKDIKNAKDAELVCHAAKFLRSSIDYWMKG
ncbi:hypothetical protein K8R32_02240, partial [bacterium]|nr:hypothetical protein [bacterium]